MIMAVVDNWPHETFHQPKGCRNKVKRAAKNHFYLRTSTPNPKHHEMLRLISFSNYPREMSCSPILLARNGFIYSGKRVDDDNYDDRVTCVFCSSEGSGVRYLTGNDDIKRFHHKLNPHCSMARGEDCGNKLIEVSDKRSFEFILNQLHGMRKMEKKSAQLPSQAKGNGLPNDDPNRPTTMSLEVDSPDTSEGQPTLNEEPHSGDGRSTSSSCESLLQNSQQAVEIEASSETITNHASSLYYPWQNSDSEAVDSGGTLVNHTSHESTLANGDDGTRPDGISTAAPQHNDAPPTPCNTTPSSNRNENVGNQQIRSDASRPHEQNSASPDSTRAQGSVNSRPDAQVIGGNTSEPRNSGDSHSQSSSQNLNSPQQGGNVEQDGAATYERLGICTARPKRPEYAVEHVRLQSYEGWPTDHFIKPDMLASAGFFYTGYGDCARCFFCGGGLRNWEEGDDVRVEHARWFQKCTFIRQNMGQAFIDVVQDLSKEQEIIPYQDVIKEMEARGHEILIPKDNEDTSPELKKDVSVKIMVDNGFNMVDTIAAAGKLKEMGHTLTSSLIFEELVRMGARKSAPVVRDQIDSGSLPTRKNSSNLAQETMDSLTDKNNELRQQSQCKICLDKEVAVVFLPCGHFVSCRDCSYALRACPMCRESIKGVVRGSLS